MMLVNFVGIVSQLCEKQTLQEIKVRADADLSAGIGNSFFTGYMMCSSNS